MTGQTEEWKQYKTRYSDIEISNLGNVRGKRWNRHPFTDNDIKIVKERRCIGQQPIYRLVWEAFNGPIPEGYVIHHIDHDKLNDSLDNLMLMTNEDHSRHHNTDPSDVKRKKMSEVKKNKKRPEQSAAIKNRIHINNGIVSKMIYPKELEMYLTQGFVLGRLPKHKRNSD